MSPNRDKFNFRKIEPKGVKAIDKTVFMVIGVGHMKIMCLMVKTLLLSYCRMYFTTWT